MRTWSATYSARFDLDCYNRIQQELAYQLYQDWIGPDFPRMLVIEIQHPDAVLRRLLRRELREQRARTVTPSPTS